MSTRPSEAPRSNEGNNIRAAHESALAGRSALGGLSHALSALDEVPRCYWCGYPLSAGIHSLNGMLECVIFSYKPVER